jgi:hypothetical protein
VPDRTDEILVHLKYLREGQDETVAHLRTLNGRVGAVEVKQASVDAQLAGMTTTGDRVPITRRDVWLVAVTLGAIGGTVKFFAWALAAIK